MSSTATSGASNGRGSDAWFRPWAHLRVARRSASYCRVTFNHPPINAITATTVAELAELVALIEEDADLNVVVFDSAIPDFYLGHCGVERTAWVDLLPRLSHAPAVSIASIRGRVCGAGMEFVRACDLRFASRENTLLGQFDGPYALRFGYVNRLIADDRLDADVDAIASKLSSSGRYEFGVGGR
jgi:enoyl-CoA hydratase/carnithine racemase